MGRGLANKRGRAKEVLLSFIGPGVKTFYLRERRVGGGGGGSKQFDAYYLAVCSLVDA